MTWHFTHPIIAALSPGKFVAFIGWNNNEPSDVYLPVGTSNTFISTPVRGSPTNHPHQLNKIKSDQVRSFSVNGQHSPPPLEPWSAPVFRGQVQPLLR